MSNAFQDSDDNLWGGSAVRDSLLLWIVDCSLRMSTFAIVKSKTCFSSYKVHWVKSSCFISL